MMKHSLITTPGPRDQRSMDPVGQNGALLDPMSMEDAALFADVPSLPDIGDSLCVDKLEDVGVLGPVTSGIDPKVVEDLQREMTEKTATIENLKNENKKLQNRVDTYDDEITDLREQFNKLQNLTESQNRKLAEFEKVNAEYASKIINLEETSKSQEKSEELEGKLKDKSEEAAKLENKIKQMETDSAALTKRNQDLIGDKNKKISELNESIADLKGSLQEKEDQASSSADEVSKLQTTVTEKEEEILKLSKSIADLKQCNDEMAMKETELTDLKSQMEKMSLEKDSISEEKSKLESDNKLLSEQVSQTSQVMNANETLTKDMDALKHEMEELKKSNDDLQKIRSSQEEKIENLDKDNESLAAKLESSEESLKAKKEKLDAAEKAEIALKAERDDIATKLSSAEQSKGLQLTLIQTQLSESKEREADLKEAMSTVNNKILIIEKDKQSLSTELNKAVTASKMFEEQLKKTCLELETTKKHKLSLEQAAGNYSKLSHEKASVDQRLLEMQKRCGDLERQAGQVKVLEQQVMHLNNSNVQMNNEMHNNRNEITCLKQHNDTLARECNNFKNQFEQNNKYMRDYSIQNGDLQKKNSELNNALKGLEADNLRLKSQLDSLSKQASQQADYGSLKNHIDSLTKVLAETKQESMTFRKDVEAKNKDLSKQKTEIDKLSRELKKANEDLEKAQTESPTVKKRPEDPDRLSLTRELHSVKKDLEAARKANIKLEKENREKEKERERMREVNKVRDVPS